MTSARGPRRISSGIARDEHEPRRKNRRTQHLPRETVRSALHQASTPAPLPIRQLHRPPDVAAKLEPSPREHRATPPHGQGLPCPSPLAVFPHPGNRRAQRARPKRKPNATCAVQVCVDGAGGGMDRRLRRLRSAWDRRRAAAVPALARAWAYRVRVAARSLTHTDIPEAWMESDTDSLMLVAAMPCHVSALRKICDGFLADRGRS